ncbi:MAG TPA: S8 family serine peptidase [Bryobacteraceae bacterium]|nr:S8 family serine peptidase [Bryobacteraceae bacterium]
MKRLFSVGLLSIFTVLVSSAQPTGRLIVRVNGGLPVIQTVCLLAGCNVAENIDGLIGQVFLVTTPASENVQSVLANLLSLTGVINVELDSVAHVADSGTAAIPPSLSDTAPEPYFGSTVPHGYLNQPATQIVRLADMQTAFPTATGGGVVAVIDTGVDPDHPALKNVLLPGYDFTRNQNGANETLDIHFPTPPVSANSQPEWVSGSGSGDLSQSTAAVVNQSTAAVVNGNPEYSDFGHGTMVAGVIHLVAPTAKILPLKAFHADGTGYNSDILRAIYLAVERHANVLNMSFSLASYSQEIQSALNAGTLSGMVSVASAGNSGEDTLVYPAAYWNVLGIASTSDNNQLSTFSNYGPQLVWVAAPGEGIITTYPFSTYAAAWGTSFSAPFTSGVASVLMGINPLCDQISGADSTSHATPIGPNAGHGILDLYQAVRSWRQAAGLN